VSQLQRVAAIGAVVVLRRRRGVAADRIFTTEPGCRAQTAVPERRSFSLTGDPLHFTAYWPTPKPVRRAAARRRLLTTDLVPQEQLVSRSDSHPRRHGHDRRAHRRRRHGNSEPHGYFSVEPPKFAMQFKGKNIHDPFRVGGDVDAVSRASISIASATRAIRDSARMVAKQLLPEASK
jgi:hypothetical protein